MSENCNKDCANCGCVDDKKAVIVGAGLVGALWSIYLQKAGYSVEIYEKRGDIRDATAGAGKSINLATSFRGWKALEEVGIADEIKKIAIPMYGRHLHYENGENALQPYGINGQAIYSVSRKDLNAKLISISEEMGKAKFFFHHDLETANAYNGHLEFINLKDQSTVKLENKIVFACDGAFSATRYSAFMRKDQFTYSQKYIPDGYREILLPANEDGTPKLAENVLHIWPRNQFMLIALPNFDNSFTCTLFMPFEDERFSFNQLKSKEDVTAFFKSTFPDFYDLMPNVADDWENHPLSSLAIVQCYPWSNERIALMGDAAHATVPFFGQGMNCGFEDCTVMNQLMLEKNHDWSAVFSAYEKSRKPNTDSMQALSVRNYEVMRSKVNEEEYLLLQRVERHLQQLYPDKYFSLYSMVAFTDIDYKVALDKGEEQEMKLMKFIMNHKITSQTPDDQLNLELIEFFKTEEIG